MGRYSQAFERQLDQILGEPAVYRQELLKDYSSFKIGGPADYLVRPNNLDQLSQVIQLCNRHQISYFILGKGSNLLFTDLGFRGVVIQLGHNFEQVQIQSGQIIAAAGVSMAKLANLAQAAGLTGLEFASGIPGTLGGAIYMNAGAYGGEMKDIVQSVKALDEQGILRSFTLEQCQLGYRTSCFQTGKWLITEVEMKLEFGDKEQIQAKMDQLNQQRKQKQPLELASAGSTFKRPEGYFAGKLIMEAGLSGYRIGDAMVSDKHCGFVVNVGQATFEQVVALIAHVQQTVLQKSGVRLEPEVRIIGQHRKRTDREKE